jgi:hypothetical protein
MLARKLLKIFVRPATGRASDANLNSKRLGSSFLAGAAGRINIVDSCPLARCYAP